MREPNWRYEKYLWRRGYRRVAGIDEAGRGPLAGPVVAAAVVFKQDKRLKRIVAELPVRDSKLLTVKQRENLYQKIIIHPLIDWGIGIVSEKIIDKINILEATKLAMVRAMVSLSCPVNYLLIDGNRYMLLPLSGDAKFCGQAMNEIVGEITTFSSEYRRRFAMTKNTLWQRTIIAGDKKVFSIACASIIAKVTRDKIMTDLHKIYPQYGFSQHKGYGTKLHFAKLAQCGVSPAHRRSFHPVSEFVRI